MKSILSNRCLVTGLCCVSIVILFFLPWIRVHAVPASVVKELIVGNSSASVLTASGAGIPRFANGASARIFLQVFGKFFDSVAHADRKSYLVWTVPVLAAVIMVLSLKFRRRLVVSGIIGLVCAALVGVVAWKIFTTDLDGVLLRIQICWAFWATLATFAALGAIHLLSVPAEWKK